MVQDCNRRIREMEVMIKLRDNALLRVLLDLRYKNSTLRTEIGMLRDEATRYSLGKDTQNLMARLGAAPPDISRSRSYPIRQAGHHQ